MRSLTEGLEDSASSSAAETSGGAGWRETVNNMLSGVGGKVILAVVAIAMLAFLFTRINAATGPAEGTAIAKPQVRIMNPATGDLAWHEIKIGATMQEGYYPVEYCWNNHSGDGVPVILNSQLYPVGDPRRNEPTTCPCCNAPVVGHNPKPEEFLGQNPTDYETGRAADCAIDHYASVLGG